MPSTPMFHAGSQFQLDKNKTRKNTLEKVKEWFDVAGKIFIEKLNLFTSREELCKHTTFYDKAVTLHTKKKILPRSSAANKVEVQATFSLPSNSILKILDITFDLSQNRLA